MEAAIIIFIWVSFILVYGALIWATVDMARGRKKYHKARLDMIEAKEGFEEARLNYEKAKMELERPVTVDEIQYDCCGNSVVQGHKETCIYKVEGAWSYRD